MTGFLALTIGAILLVGAACLGFIWTQGEQALGGRIDLEQLVHVETYPDEITQVEQLAQTLTGGQMLAAKYTLKKEKDWPKVKYPTMKKNRKDTKLKKVMCTARRSHGQQLKALLANGWSKGGCPSGTWQ